MRRRTRHRLFFTLRFYVLCLYIGYRLGVTAHHAYHTVSAQSFGIVP